MDNATILTYFLCSCLLALQGNVNAVAESIATAAASGGAEAVAEAQTIAEALAQGGGTASSVSQAVGEAYANDPGSVASVLADAISIANARRRSLCGPTIACVCMM